MTLRIELMCDERQQPHCRPSLSVLCWLTNHRAPSQSVPVIEVLLAVACAPAPSHRSHSQRGYVLRLAAVMDSFSGEI